VIITLIAGFVILVGLSFLVLELAPRKQGRWWYERGDGQRVLSTNAVARGWRTL